MTLDEPVGEVFKMRVLDYSPREIKEHLADHGITMTEKRIRTLCNNMGDDAVQWIRTEYMDEAARTILDYREQINTMVDWFRQRFIEAQREYDEYVANKGTSVGSLLEQYKQDPNPDLDNYVKRIHALTEGLNLQKLTKVTESQSRELNRWNDLAARLDNRLTSSQVNITQINVENQVEQIYEALCSECKEKLSEL